MEERKCKQCGCDISDRNMNTIFCNQNCRAKWRYNNEEGLKDKKKESTYKRRHDRMIERVINEELERVKMIKMIKSLE